MKSNVQNKIKAISLRMQGYSYSEIMKEVPVSKGTLSGWIKRITLNSEQEAELKARITVKQGVGRAAAVISNTRRRQVREERVQNEATKLFEQYKGDTDFIIGVCLYWAEGSKRSDYLSFINSDPEMVICMYQWMQKYLKVDKKSIKIRLFMHSVFEKDELEAFWEEFLSVSRETFLHTIFKPTNHPVKKPCSRRANDSRMLGTFNSEIDRISLGI